MTSLADLQTKLSCAITAKAALRWLENLGEVTPHTFRSVKIELFAGSALPGAKEAADYLGAAAEMSLSEIVEAAKLAAQADIRALSASMAEYLSE